MTFFEFELLLSLNWLFLLNPLILSEYFLLYEFFRKESPSLHLLVEFLIELLKLGNFILLTSLFVSIEISLGSSFSISLIIFPKIGSLYSPFILLVFFSSLFPKLILYLKLFFFKLSLPELFIILLLKRTSIVPFDFCESFKL